MHDVGVADEEPIAPWDDLLFAGAAAFYEQGRLPYPRDLAQAIGHIVGLNESSRVLDVGCGPGSIALRLACRAAEVVGVDPDPGMIAEARRLAVERELRNARFVELRAEALPANLGAFDLVTFAASFHWMDRPRVAGIVQSMLNTQGAVVIISGGWNRARPAPEAPFPEPPWEAITELVHRYLGPERRAGRGTREADPTDLDGPWSTAGLRGPQVISVRDHLTYERTADDIVAGTLSRSLSAPHLFGDRLDSFRSDLWDLLLKVSPVGRFSFQMADTSLRVWRLGDKLAEPDDSARVTG